MLRSLVVISVVASASPVAADPDAPTDRAGAASAFAAAERSFADQDYPEALRLFRLAFERAPSDVVRFNIAVCLERLGRFREASAEYEAAAASPSLPADVRARARAQVDRVRGRLGTLEVTGAPAGATVTIDDVALCRLPCTIAVDPGRRDVAVEAGPLRERAVVVVTRGAVAKVRLVAEQAETHSRGPGALTWIGAGATALGITGTVVFGLRARSLHDDYVREPTLETREDGLRSRNLTNVSIAVGVLGVAAIALDLLVFARRDDGPRSVSTRTSMLEIRF